MPDFSEQKKTLDNCRRLLEQYAKCFLIRPTGFGKTWLLTELIKSYKKTLYLYPSQVIRDTVVDRYFDLPDQDPDEPIDPETAETYRAMGQIPGCTLMTYAKLARMAPEEFDDMQYDLVICDEAHRMGGPKTKMASERLFAILDENTRFIGATATPTRMDNFDVSSHFFMDRLCYPYTLHDAVKSGMIQKFNYCYATYDFRRDLEDAANAAGEDLRDPYVQETISTKMIELGKLYNMPKIIREVCDKYAARTDYMKFIIFFANKKHIQEKCHDVETWFQEAYPDHTVRTLRITSASAEEKSNVDKLSMLTPQDMRIDLVACIDMLNMGYHVPDQTGVMMYRGTESGTIFTQQFGRALCAGAGSSAIVFDIVDNLHRKAVYELYVKPQGGPSTRKRRNMEPKLDNYRLDTDGMSILAVTADGSTIPTQYHYDGAHVLDKLGNKAPFKIDRTGAVRNTSDARSDDKDVNRIGPDCLNATGHEAAYRDVLKKAMVEPLAHRCKFAIQMHFYSWCAARGIDYPITDKRLTELYGLDIADFHKELLKIIRDGKINYPLHDAEKLLETDSNGTDPPLTLCCQATNVDVKTLMDMLFQ